MRHGFVIALFVLPFIAGCSGVPAKGPDAIDPDAPEKFTVSDSGLKYRIRRQGNGNSPAANSTVRVDYRGWLDNGEEFDSSYKRGKTIEFNLGEVVRGWTEGLQYVSEGGMIELEIPGHLGYGPKGMGRTIPPNATLHFIIELHEVK